MATRRPTLQERIEILVKRSKLNLGRLAKKAGLNPTHLRTIMADKKRTELQGKTAYGLAWAAQASLGWVSTGVGSEDADDVPIIPPDKLKSAAFEDMPSWPQVVLKAIGLDRGKLDWAIIGVGEMPASASPFELTPYYVLHEAEKLAKRLAHDLPERERLDIKVRDFMAEHAGTREPETRKRPSRPAGKNR